MELVTILHTGGTHLKSHGGRVHCVAVNEPASIRAVLTNSLTRVLEERTCDVDEDGACTVGLQQCFGHAATVAGISFDDKEAVADARNDLKKVAGLVSDHHAFKQREYTILQAIDANGSRILTALFLLKEGGYVIEAEVLKALGRYSLLNAVLGTTFRPVPPKSSSVQQGSLTMRGMSLLGI